MISTAHSSKLLALSWSSSQSPSIFRNSICVRTISQSASPLEMDLKKQSPTPPHCTFLKDTPCTVISLLGDAALSEVLICPGTMFIKDVWSPLNFCSSSFYLKACLIFFWANTSLSSASMFMLKDYCEYFILTTLVLEIQDTGEKASLNKYPTLTTIIFP